jgi:uncharacterized caspase-like protein
MSAAAFFAVFAAQAANDRVALVIGNRDYAYSPLENPLNDARDMRDKLKSLGFEVVYRENADLQSMETAVGQFGEKLRGRQVGLFYYSGHGIQYEGENFLIPVDNANFSENSLKYKALNVGLLLDTMKSAAHPVSIVILDACRDNPFRGFRAMGSRGLANVSGPAGSLLAFATAPGQTAADGIGGRNGIYTKHLLAHLDTPDITVEELFKRVRRGVGSETVNRQVTWENSSLSGDFCFVNCPKESVAAQVEMDSLQQHNRLLEERLKQLEGEKERQAAREEKLAELERERQRLQAEVGRLTEKADTQSAAEVQRLADELETVRREKAALGQDARQSQEQEAQQRRETARIQKLLEENRELQARMTAQQEEFRRKEEERLQVRAEPGADDTARGQPAPRRADLPPAF